MASMPETIVVEVVYSADAQALADVRTLDEWAHADDSRERKEGPCYGVREPKRFYCTLSGELRATLAGPFYGPTPDAARAAAAAWVRDQAKRAERNER